MERDGGALGVTLESPELVLKSRAAPGSLMTPLGARTASASLAVPGKGTIPGEGDGSRGRGRFPGKVMLQREGDAPQSHHGTLAMPPCLPGGAWHWVPTSPPQKEKSREKRGLWFVLSHAVSLDNFLEKLCLVYAG